MTFGARDLTIGVDVGTTSVKGVLVDNAGNVRASVRIPHRVAFPAPDRIEHDARKAWRQAPRRVLARLGTSEVRGIGVTGMGPSLTAVNRNGVPQGPGLLYGDARGREMQDGSGESFGFLRALATERPWAAGFWPAQTTAIVSLGGPPVIGETIAMMMQPLWNGTGWDEDRLAACGVRVGQMPAVCPDGSPATIGTSPVIEAGSLDAACEALAAGTVGADEMLVLLGSTLVMLMPVPNGTVVPGIWSYPTDMGWMATGASNAGGLFLDWVDQVVARSDGHVDPERVPIWTPYIRGERTPWHDPMRRASLIDLNVTHDASSIRRAAFEASGFVVRHHMELCGCRPRSIVAAGGGSAVAQWIQALADCTGIPVTTTGTVAGAAIGAAFMARVAAGLEESPADAVRWARRGATIVPDPTWQEAVYGRYQRFLELVSDVTSSNSKRSSP